MTKSIEITAVYLHETYRNGEFAIAKARPTGDAVAAWQAKNGQPLFGDDSLTVKGEWTPDEIKEHAEYRFFGHWDKHAKYGWSFSAKTFVRAKPHGRAGVIRYLVEAPHVGHAVATALWEKFQGDAVRLLREQPAIAADAIAIAVHGFTPARAAEAAQYLAKLADLEGCTIELVDLLDKRGLPKSTARKALARWGNKAPEILKRNPYALMAFRGCGFTRADQLYLDLGHPPAKLKRQAYAAWHALASNTDGHTWHAVEDASRGIAARVSSANVDDVAALLLAKRGKLIATRRDGDSARAGGDAGNLWVAEQRKSEAELRCARYIAEALAETGPLAWPPAKNLAGVTPHQAERYGLATAGRIGLLTGTPGTGKTYTTAAAVKAIVAAHGARAVAVAAPTGKAAVRVTDAMAAYGVPVAARTIHGLLGVEKREEGDGWSFVHDATNPLPHRFIIVDESSMIDTTLFASLLAARSKGCHLLLVGDPNQLPPVGHGAPLRDLIAAGIGCGELTEIQRNAGTIVRACAQIRAGQTFETEPSLDLDAEPPRNLKVLPASTSPQAIAQMFNVLDAARGQGLDPIWDCQVLCAVNARSPLSRRKLNAVLQERLNPHGKGSPGGPFRVGDKIVNLKNGFFQEFRQDLQDGQDAEQVRQPEPEESPRSQDGKLFVANGELAAVVKVEAGSFVARLSNPTRIIKVFRGKQADDANGDAASDDADPADAKKQADAAPRTGCTWDLGFALSVHKSQGSEWPIVAVMIDEYPGAKMVCSRQWIYTAISRAKKACLLIGNKGTAHGFCRRDALWQRKTFLAERIREERERSRRTTDRTNATDEEKCMEPATC